MYNIPAPPKPSERDKLSKIPFWAMNLIAYAFLVYESWWSASATAALYNIDISSIGMKIVTMGLSGLLSLAFAYVIGILLHSVFTSMTRMSVIIPRNSFIRVFYVARIILAVVIGSVSFAFPTNPLQYRFISSVVRIIALLLGAIFLYVYTSNAYQVNTAERACCMKAIFIPYLIYIAVDIGVLMI